jgi:carbon-monoxide dehydrogenase medium subunit
VRARETEKMLEGIRPDEKLIQEAAQSVAKECRPISDVRSTATYRKGMIKILVERAILQALTAGR